MDKLDPFLSLDENVEELDLDGSLQEFFKLMEEERRKDEANECTVMKCPDCEGLLVQVLNILPLEVKCMSCKNSFLLRDVVNL